MRGRGDLAEEGVVRSGAARATTEIGGAVRDARAVGARRRTLLDASAEVLSAPAGSVRSARVLRCDLGARLLHAGRPRVRHRWRRPWRRDHFSVRERGVGSRVCDVRDRTVERRIAGAAIGRRDGATIGDGLHGVRRRACRREEENGHRVESPHCSTSIQPTRSGGREPSVSSRSWEPTFCAAVCRALHGRTSGAGPAPLRVSRAGERPSPCTKGRRWYLRGQGESE